MNIKNLFEDFEKQYLYVGEPRKPSRFEDKQLNKIDVMYAFSCYVNYHSDTCIYIIKDTNLSTLLFNDIKKKYDLTRLYLNYEKLHELI